MSFRPGERAELLRQGAKAAARGDTADSNPLLLRHNLPSITGECQRFWARRRDAWLHGWEFEAAAATLSVRMALDFRAATARLA